MAGARGISRSLRLQSDAAAVTPELRGGSRSRTHGMSSVRSQVNAGGLSEAEAKAGGRGRGIRIRHFGPDE